jgi:hypothetical protein
VEIGTSHGFTPFHGFAGESIRRIGFPCVKRSLCRDQFEEGFNLGITGSALREVLPTPGGGLSFAEAIQALGGDEQGELSFGVWSLLLVLPEFGPKEDLELFNGLLRLRPG